MRGTIHLRSRQIFTIFDPHPPPVGSFLLLSVGKFGQFLTPPPGAPSLKNADVLNGWSHRLYAVLYTSGSTGTPKGARILHSAVLNRLMWQWEKFPYQPNDVCAFKVSMYQILSFQFIVKAYKNVGKFKIQIYSLIMEIQLLFFGGS